MQDEKRQGISQEERHEEVVTRMIAIINDAATELCKLVDEIQKDGCNVDGDRFLRKVDNSVLESADFLGEFCRILVQGTMVNMVKKAINKVEEYGEDYEKAFIDVAKESGIDCQIIQFGGDEER